MLTEPQAERLFDEAFGGWLQAQLDDPPEGIRRALRRSCRPLRRRARAGRTRSIVCAAAAWELAQWRDFTAPWTPASVRSRRARSSALAGELHEFAAMSEQPSYANDVAVPRYRAGPPSQPGDRAAAGRSTPDPTPVDATAGKRALVDLSRDRISPGAGRARTGLSQPAFARPAGRRRLETSAAELDGFRLDADADLAAALQQELTGAIDALRGAQGARRRARLPRSAAARRAIWSKATTPVRRGFQPRFTHIFVDEFQDTDPLQAEILLLLAAGRSGDDRLAQVDAGPGKLFIVGDPKQSIYRFRRADVGIYARSASSCVDTARRACT